jgi:L-asparaginase
MAATLAIDGLKALVLETYGSGNAPSKPWFIRCLSEACAKGIVIVNVTQCNAGTVEMERYNTGYHYCRQGLLADMTALQNRP